MTDVKDEIPGWTHMRDRLAADLESLGKHGVASGEGIDLLKGCIAELTRLIDYFSSRAR